MQWALWWGVDGGSARRLQIRGGVGWALSHCPKAKSTPRRENGFRDPCPAMELPRVAVGLAVVGAVNEPAGPAIITRPIDRPFGRPPAPPLPPKG